MKLFSVILSIGVILVASTEAKVLEGRIIGGDPAEIANHPYIVSVAMQYGREKLHSCGGSIIADNWVLTAAHCETPIEGTRIRAGSTFSDEGGVTAKVLEVITHKDYNPATFDNDIALLKLDRPITGANGGSIIKLAPQNQAVNAGQVVRVSGWGLTVSGATDSSETLETVEVDIIDHATCGSQYGGNQITQNMICASRLGKDSCQMDSGGPLVVNENELVGIVSWGIDCAHERFPGVYTNAANYRDWIRENSGV